MLHIYRSSRIERLADLLAAHLLRWQPQSVLSPQRLIVGHLGMKRWLTQHLAEQRLGALPRIAANLSMLLPSEWLDELAQKVLGSEAIAIAPYRRPALRWRIYQALPALDDAQVVRYLQGEDAPRRRFQLADRLAGLYGQYLVYRRDWLAAWERGGTAGIDPPHWQGPLWRQLVAEIGLKHRGQRMQELAARMQRLRSDPEQPALYIFGVSHLPPDALGALEELTATRQVCVYFPDPCRELWDDLRTRRQVYRAQLDSDAYLGIGHPLLAALGRMGQHFALQLNALAAAQDERDVADDEPEGTLAASLLDRVQHSVRCLRPDWAQRPDDASVGMRLDASLRVHVCHTRLRELEVLKDALLAQLAADPALHPRHMVVMAPNMALYAPLLPVVFGEPGRNEGALPYHLSDVALVRMHPLLGAFRELLDLPTQRITRSQVLALLALPAVARRFDLSHRGHEALARWLDRCHVAWGLDGAMKQDFAAAPVDDHSFAFGLDRMAAGFLVGHEDPDWLLDRRILPADPVHGPDSACLGALWGLIELLREWRTATAEARPLRQWSERLQDWLGRLLLGDAEDADEGEALASVLKLIASLERESTLSGVDPVVDWTVVREVLIQGLDGIPERQAFLSGSLTFCGMVPQRAIPFRVIALLGLNDGEYPRVRPDNGLDLMQRHPRLGDRDNRMDDRYLFLEALMSARSALHLSYIGEGAQDGKPRNPAAPLGELLGFLDEVHGLDSGDAQVDRPWRVRHPLQAFDARYFDANGDPRLYSYSAEFAAVRAGDRQRPWQFMADPVSPASAAASAHLELTALTRYYQRPGEWWCKHALGLSRAALDADAADDQEPLTSAPERFDRGALDLVWDALHSGSSGPPLTPPARLLRSGQLAAGAVGERAYATIQAQAQAMLDCARSLPPFAHGPAQPAPIAVDLAIGATRLVGRVASVYRSSDALWLVLLTRSTDISFQHLLPLYLQWAALRLSAPEQAAHCALIHAPGGEPPVAVHALDTFPDDCPTLRAGLATLIDAYHAAADTSSVYFPKTSYVYAQALDRAAGASPEAADNARARALTSWLGNYGHTGERDYAPGYNALLAGPGEFLEADSDAHARFGELAQSLFDLIRAPAAVGAAP